MEKLFLIYVNYVGKDYRGNHLYEFIFSDSTQNIDGEDWDTFPASNRPQPPHEIHIKKVGRLESELRLDVVQGSDTFAVWDAIDGVIALAWENINDYDTYPEYRMCFKFGDTMKQVVDNLYAKDLVLEFNDKKYEKSK